MVQTETVQYLTWATLIVKYMVPLSKEIITAEQPITLLLILDLTAPKVIFITVYSLKQMLTISGVINMTIMDITI